MGRTIGRAIGMKILVVLCWVGKCLLKVEDNPVTVAVTGRYYQKVRQTVALVLPEGMAVPVTGAQLVALLAVVLTVEIEIVEAEFGV